MENRKKANWSSSGFTKLSVMVFLFLASLSIPESSAKRFDCRMFCKETGFHGMVGGCRCSFTLFTAKRAIRDPVDLEKLPQVKNFHNSNPAESRELLGVRTFSEESSPAEKIEQSRELSPKFRYLKYVNLGPTLEDTSSMKTAPESYADSHLVYGDLTKKRREIEQDLDNGETADFLRMPY